MLIKSTFSVITTRAAFKTILLMKLIVPWIMYKAKTTKILGKLILSLQSLLKKQKIEMP